MPPVRPYSLTPGQLIEVEAVQPETKTHTQVVIDWPGLSPGGSHPSSGRGPCTRRLLIRVVTKTRWYVFPGCTGVSMFPRVVI